MSKRLYQKGEKITSLDELMKQEFVYMRHKITHKGWFFSWQIRLMKNWIDLGWIYKAEKIEGDNNERE